MAIYIGGGGYLLDMATTRNKIQSCTVLGLLPDMIKEEMM